MRGLKWQGKAGRSVLCGSPKPDLREHTLGLLIYLTSILGHTPENRVGTLKV